MQIIFLLFLIFPAILSAETSNIRIGAIASLSGPAAEQGKNWLEGARLAESELKAEGLRIDLIVEDDQTRPAQVVSAFHKLATIDKVSGVLGGTWDFLAEAAGPLAQKYKLPFVTPTNPDEILSKEAKANPWFFTTGLSMAATTDALLPFLRQSKVKKVAVLVPNVPFGIAHKELLENWAKESGAEIVLSQAIDFEGYRDVLRGYALRLTSSEKPDLIFCLTDYAALDIFNAEIRKRGFGGYLITTQHLDEAVALSKKPAQWAKAIGIYPSISDKTFSARFERLHGHSPKVYAAEGYDAFLFIARALESGKDVSKESFSVAGVTGNLSSSPTGRRLITNVKAVLLKPTVDGKLIPLEGQ